MKCGEYLPQDSPYPDNKNQRNLLILLLEVTAVRLPGSQEIGAETQATQL